MYIKNRSGLIMYVPENMESSVFMQDGIVVLSVSDNLWNSRGVINGVRFGVAVDKEEPSMLLSRILEKFPNIVSDSMFESNVGKESLDIELERGNVDVVDVEDMLKEQIVEQILEIGNGRYTKNKLSRMNKISLISLYKKLIENGK